MMKRKALWSFILAFLLALPIIGTALAAPPILPAGYLGTVTVNGANVADGTKVTAWINGTQYVSADTQMYNGESWYSLDVPGDDPNTTDVVEGALPTDTITFKIDGQDADQTATWAAGTSTELDLTVDDDEIDAKFTCTPVSGAAPLEVTCIDESTGNITGWSWNFGDGTTSTDQNPAAHTYSANGSYTVSLTVTGADGSDTESKTGYISVSDDGDDASLICKDVAVYPNGTIAVLLEAQGTDVYGLQTTVDVDNPALVDLLDTTFGDFFTQPIAMASNQKNADDS